MLEISNPGLLSLLVDKGKTGIQHAGLKMGGPMDEVAFGCANVLLGNRQAQQQNAIEVIGNARFIAKTTCIIAVTGPKVDIEINGVKQSSWSALVCKSKDTISLKVANSGRVGQRYYLAVQGGFKSIIAAGKTYHKLDKGSELGFNQAASAQAKIARLAEGKNSYDYNLDKPIHVILGYQYQAFDKQAIEEFLSQSYTLSPQCDRMGYCLTGKAIDVGAHEMYSEGLHKGAIQFPPNGQPIVMLSDRQTLGGYPKIGAVAKMDLPRLVQAVPGQTLQFAQTDVYTARNVWRLFWRRISADKR